MGSEAVPRRAAPGVSVCEKLDALLRRTLEQRGSAHGEVSRYAILEDGMVHMARMAILPPTPPTVWRACTLRY